MKPSKPSSVIAWRGVSMLTGDPIQVALTGIEHPSKNEKTGPMVQAWIVRQDGNPSKDLGTDRERAICGDCALRGRGKKRICYVAYGVWRLAEFLPSYPLVPLDEAAERLRGKMLRLGAYGDPAAVPIPVWKKLLKHVAGWTGYTHQWRTCNPEFKTILMASVEDALSAIQAEAAGWRYFRVKHPQGEGLIHEIRCPAETRGVTCDNCQLCRGTNRPAKNISINVHGSGASHFLRIVQGDLLR